MSVTAWLQQLRIATAWDTKPRKSLLLIRPQASTQLSEGQGTQTPFLAPRAPPSRLKPERGPMKVIVFLHERKQGAGQVGQHAEFAKAQR